MKDKTKQSVKFSLMIAVITFVLAAIFSSFSSALLGSVSWIIGFLIVLFIVFIGIIFDMLGIAAAAAKDAPLHAMAAEKVLGAREAVLIHRNADKVASFSNDVIGDISGIVSGSALTIVIIQITQLLQKPDGSTFQIVLSILMTSFIAALTVGGKAFGKYYAINYSTNILLYTGKVIYFIEQKLRIKIFKNAKR
ncbi:MAG TPA: hypothetical protein VFF20_05805 [Pseudogracilibacillus sp.]|nr:hypothetical protein [Pseudogracilibacillus sp.]